MSGPNRLGHLDLWSAQVYGWAVELANDRLMGRTVGVTWPSRQCPPAADHLVRADLVRPLDWLKLAGAGDFGNMTRIVVIAAEPGSWPQSAALLKSLLRKQVVLWGMTGPRPNVVADHCHDGVAVNASDTVAVAWIHRLLARRLAGAAIRMIEQAANPDQSPAQRHAM